MTFQIGDRIVTTHPAYGTYEAVITGIQYHDEGGIKYYEAGKHWIRPDRILGKTSKWETSK